MKLGKDELDLAAKLFLFSNAWHSMDGMEGLHDDLSPEGNKVRNVALKLARTELANKGFGPNDLLSLDQCIERAVKHLYKKTKPKGELVKPVC